MSTTDFTANELEMLRHAVALQIVDLQDHAAPRPTDRADINRLRELLNKLSGRPFAHGSTP